MDDIVGENKLRNQIMMYKTQVTLRVDIISNICWKGQLPQ